MQLTVVGYASQAAFFYGIDPRMFFARHIQEHNMGWVGVG